jgi:hypothetical protein
LSRRAKDNDDSVEERIDQRHSDSDERKTLLDSLAKMELSQRLRGAGWTFIREKI